MQAGLLQEGLHVFLNAGPVHLNVPPLGQELEGHEEEAQDQGQKAAHLFEGVAHRVPGEAAEGHLPEVRGEVGERHPFHPSGKGAGRQLPEAEEPGLSPHGLEDEGHVLLQGNPQLLGPKPDLLPVHPLGEGLVLELLLEAGELQA